MTEEQLQPRTSFSQRALIGVGLGIGVGLFIGEYAAPLESIGQAYVGLLQMTVLPYVFVSLIGNIAKLSLGGGKLLVRRAGLTLLGLWIIGLAALPIVAFAFPAWEVGSFFSTSLLEERPAIDYQTLYIPSNPFHSLANNLVPAVALFCILAGAVAIGMPKKEGSQRGRHALGTAVRSAAGLLDRARHRRGPARFRLFATCVTPLTYREVLRAAKDPLLTAFVTGSTFVTLPMIVENTKRCWSRRGWAAPTSVLTWSYRSPIPSRTWGRS